jgi:heme/copper-type cytochrome/quinol oxidase subunit 1
MMPKDNAMNFIVHNSYYVCGYFHVCVVMRVWMYD